MTIMNQIAASLFLVTDRTYCCIAVYVRGSMSKALKIVMLIIVLACEAVQKCRSKSNLCVHCRSSTSVTTCLM